MKIFEKQQLKLVLAVMLWIFVCTNLAVAAGALPTRTWSDQRDGGYNRNDVGFSVDIDSQGNVITSGYKAGYIGTEDHNYDAYAIKYDGNGNIVCTILYDSGPKGGSGGVDSADAFFAVKVDSEDNIILAGSISGDYPNLGYHSAMYLQKYDSNCNPKWAQPVIYKYPGDSAWQNAQAIAVDKEDNIYVAGSVFAGWGGPQHQWAIWKYDKDGNAYSGFPIFYNYSWNYYLYDYAYGIAVDSTRNIIAAGVRGVSGCEGCITNDLDWHVRKYDPSGTLVWEHTYSGEAKLLDYAYKVTVDSKDNIIVAGYTNTGANNTTNVKWGWLVTKYSKDGVEGLGQVLWQYTYASPSGKSGAALNLTVDGDDNVVVAGYRIEGSDQVIGRLVLLNGSNGTELDELLFEDGNVVLYSVARRGNFMAVTGYNGMSPNYDFFTALLTTNPPLIAPTEGTEWESRSKQTIQWDKTFISGKSKVNLSYSTDSGQNWISIKANAPNNGKFVWTIPDITPAESIDTCAITVASVNSPQEILTSPLFSIGFPEIQDFNSKRVYIGETITITGRFLGTKAGKVNFGKFLGKIPVGSWTPNAITVQVPKNALTGTFTITTQAKNEEASPENLVILPQITKLSPSSQSVGKVVNIFGSGFGVSPGTVLFSSGLTAEITSWKDTKIMVKIPLGAVTGPIQVTNAAGDSATSPTDFQVK